MKTDPTLPSNPLPNNPLLRPAIKPYTTTIIPPPPISKSRNTLAFALPTPPILYDHNKPLHPDFFRISGHIGMQDLIKSSFTTEHISTKTFQKKLDSIQKILDATDYKDQLEEGHRTLLMATEICRLTLAEYTSSSPYHNKADHQAVKRFCAKLIATPPENLPSYEKAAQSFQDPTWWELLYLGLYTYLGPTALKIRREGKKIEKKAKMDTLKGDRINDYGIIKKGLNTKANRDKATRNFTYVEVIFPMQPKFETWNEKQPIIASLIEDITLHIFDRVPNTGIHKMTVASNLNKPCSPYFHDTPSDTNPTKQGQLNKIPP